MKASLSLVLVVSLSVVGRFGCLVSSAQEANTPLQRILVIARDARQPLGIVLGNDLSMCKGDTWSAPDLSTDPLEAIGTIGRHYGYTLDGTDPPVLRNSITTSDHLREGLRYRYSSFPAMHGTMPYLSATLTGWMQTEYGHARAYAMSIGSAPDAEQDQLTPSVNASTEEIAGKIVSLGGKGVWIASDLGGDASSGLRLQAYSYVDDLRQIQFIKCN